MSLNYRVTFRKKRTGEVYSGTCHDDGLSSLISVNLDSGGTALLSVLDEVLVRERIANQPEGQHYLAGASESRWS